MPGQARIGQTLSNACRPGELTELPSLPGWGQVNGERFHAKVRAFLHQHEDHIAIHKLRRDIALTLADLDELNRMLPESGELDREKLDHAVAEAGGSLSVFVRSLVGLDRGAVNDALSDFLQDTALSANQIEFLNMVVEYLTRHGVLTPTQLFESPFTDIAPRGPDVIFPQQRFDELVVVNPLTRSPGWSRTATGVSTSSADTIGRRGPIDGGAQVIAASLIEPESGHCRACRRWKAGW